jgi:hypothetical protein
VTELCLYFRRAVLICVYFCSVLFFYLSFFFMVLHSLFFNQAKELQANFVHLSLLSKWVSYLSYIYIYIYILMMSLVSDALSTI